MRKVNYQNAGQPANMTGQLCIVTEVQRMPPPPPPTKSFTATTHALEELANIATNGSFNHPNNLTHDGILDYALALIRVRECAGRAGMERLVNACDALAITISELIDDQTKISLEKCKALTRFIVYAQEMTLMAANEPA